MRLPSPILSPFPNISLPSLSSDSSRSFYWMTDASPSPILSLFPLNMRTHPLHPPRFRRLPLSPPVRSSSLASSDQSRSFYWMTDASPSPVLSLFPLNITPSLSSDSSRSFYWTTDASPSLVQACLSTAVALSTGSRMRPPFNISLSPHIYRPTHVTPSYTLFTFLSHHIYRPTHVTPSYTHFSFLFRLSSDPRSLLQHIPISPFSFIYRPTHVTPSTYTPFTFHFHLMHRPDRRRSPHLPFYLYNFLSALLPSLEPARPLLHSATDAGAGRPKLIRALQPTHSSIHSLFPHSDVFCQPTLRLERNSNSNIVLEALYPCLIHTSIQVHSVSFAAARYLSAHRPLLDPRLS